MKQMVKLAVAVAVRGYEYFEKYGEAENGGSLAFLMEDSDNEDEDANDDFVSSVQDAVDSLLPSRKRRSAPSCVCNASPAVKSNVLATCVNKRLSHVLTGTS